MDNIRYQDIELEALNKTYRELAELIGVENAIKIYKNYRGLQVNFPIRLYSREYVIEKAIKEYERGEDIKNLAVEYGYSERWLREMMVTSMKERKEDG